MSMPKRTSTRIAWYTLGGVLLASIATTVVLRYVPAPEKSWFRMLADLGVLLDVLAFLLWMLVLAMIASRRHND
jgi:hypothetical protein